MRLTHRLATTDGISVPLHMAPPRSTPIVECDCGVRAAAHMATLSTVTIPDRLAEAVSGTIARNERPDRVL